MDLNLHWQSGMKFNSEIRGHSTPIDAAMSVGGTNTAPTPKELVLTGVAGCSGMDAIAYLRKKKMEPLDFNIQTQAELTNTTPKYFSKIHLVYKFFGDSLDSAEVIKSVESSMTKYCGVSFMISKTCPITYDVELNNETIFSGEARFSIP